MEGGEVKGSLCVMFVGGKWGKGEVIEMGC